MNTDNDFWYFREIIRSVEGNMGQLWDVNYISPSCDHKL